MEKDKIEFRRVPVEIVRDHCPKLNKMHYEEVCPHSLEIPLSINWPEYEEIQRKGALFTIIIIVNDAIMGYAWFTLLYPTHYQDTLHAINNVIYVHPKIRKSGIGLKFIRYLEKELKQIGVKKIYFNSKVKTNFPVVLEHFNYIPEEIIYSKWIGD